MKQIAAILLMCSFLVNCIVVPFCNFQDTVSAKTLYEQFLESDRDGNVLEFITGKLLNMETLFEDEDEEEQDLPQKAPFSQQQPLHSIQISPGLFINQPQSEVEKEEQIIPRVFCLFSKDNYKSDFTSFIFHPPAFAS